MAEFSERFAQYFKCNEIPVHIWMGTSVESEQQLSRLGDLRHVRCQVRFVIFEPLLGPITNPDLSGVHWAIIGGESGAGYRPVQKEWVTGLIGACKRQGVPVFFKQWGGPRPGAGGRRIDGQVYDEYPNTSKTVQSVLQ